jgi:hypothetical protein
VYHLPVNQIAILAIGLDRILADGLLRFCFLVLAEGRSGKVA